MTEGKVGTETRYHLYVAPLWEIHKRVSFCDQFWLELIDRPKESLAVLHA